MVSFKRVKGFTLIELLIVIAIIAILATIVTVSYAGAQKKARDNRRRADVQSISSALQVNYTENKIWYIPGSGSGGIGIGYYSSNYSTGTATYLSIHDALEQSGYLNPAPTDPLYPKRGTGCVNGSTCLFDYMVYRCSSNGGVSISAVMEIPVQSEIDEARESCNGSGGNSIVDRYGQTYAVTVR